jgi:glutamyl-Q tRNA(Asp) synthetase
MLAHDLARAANGQFLLRIEDIDASRCRAEFSDAIYEDLAWLGLDWDGEIMVQSARHAVYSDALARLDAMGLVYRCVCTRREVAESVGAPQGDAAPLYPGTCRELRLSEGAWRLDMTKAVTMAGRLYWQDMDAGMIVANPQAQGDIVIARKDAATSYHLAATIDDAAQGISHVVRGNDLYAATHIHRLLQALLDLPTPIYRHHRLVTGDDGLRLAKRKQSPTLASLRSAGMNPHALMKMMRAGRFPVGFALADA